VQNEKPAAASPESFLFSLSVFIVQDYSGRGDIITRSYVRTASSWLAKVPKKLFLPMRWNIDCHRPMEGPGGTHCP